MEKTIIARGGKINGDIFSKTNLLVFGEIEGTIDAQESVTLESGCNVIGKITAKTLYVKGTFNGSVDCTNVNILNGGKFIGDIKSEILVIDAKGSFEGKNEVIIKNNKTTNVKKLHKELDTENILL